MDYPTSTTPVAGSVKVTIPAGWYTYISGLSRNTYNQMIRIRYTDGDITGTEYFNSEWGRENDTMKLRRTHGESLAISRSESVQTLELETYFSTNRNIKDRLLERPANNAGSKGLNIVQTQTPPHLRKDFPNYVTFFVFVQDSATQVATDFTPLHNDAICTINVIKGTGLDPDGRPLEPDSGSGSGGGGTGTGEGTGIEGGTGTGGETGTGPALISRNAEIGPGEKVIARPSSEEPVGNSVKINKPAGWFAFISGLSRAKYNQAIRLQYTEENLVNTEYLTSEFGSTDDIMKNKHMQEGYGLFASSKDAIIMDTSFFWSKGNVKGDALAKSEFSSQKLKLVEAQTSPDLRDYFPDYVTYFIMGEDQVEAERVAGVPEYNDIVGIVNLIKNTPMVFNAAA